MFRRDYVIKMIEECMQALMRIRQFRKDGRWQEAQSALDEEFQKLAALGPKGIAALSETELLARRMQDQPTQAVHDRLFMAIALLSEAGEIAAAENRAGDAHEIRLKALELLLNVSAKEGPDGHPAYVPRVEELALSLAGEPVPIRTRALLMRHCESAGQWDKAEDQLFLILDETSNHPASLELGESFYERVLGQRDSVLEAGNLPRAEAEEGLRELHSRGAPVQQRF